jgi:hypothetical protein
MKNNGGKVPTGDITKLGPPPGMVHDGCLVPDCTGEVRSLGYCIRHCYLLWKYGASECRRY